VQNSNDPFYLAHQKLVKDVSDLKIICRTHRQQDKKIVFTTGVFDLIHEGHMNFLSDAKQFGDILIVALHTDESIQKIRGQEYPMHTLSERMKVLNAVSDVDLMISFTGQYPLEAIQKVCPEIYVKGENFDYQNSPEVNAIESYGGELRILPFQAKSIFSENKKIDTSVWRVPPFFWSYISL
jgi:rfaE bifunctional protein nucleotidyltransferase chain/domain